MKHLLLFFSLAWMLSCNHTDNHVEEVKAAVANQDAAFDRYKNVFVEELWKLYPDWATSQGYHKYDEVLVIPDQQSRQSRLAFVKTQLDSLAKFPKGSLNANNETDWLLMTDFLKSTEWGITTLKSHEWDPSGYNYGSGIADILNNKKENLDNKIGHINAKLSRLGDYFAAARANLKTPTKEHTELAISQLKGTIDYLNSALGDSILALKDPALRALRMVSMHQARAVTDTFIAYLESIQANIQKGTVKPRDFRLGKELYAKKFEFEIQSGLSAQEIYDKAIARKTELHHEMGVIAKRLWPKYMAKAPVPAKEEDMIKALIEAISKTHVKRGDFQKEIEREIPILTEFVKRKNLLYMDPSKPLVVRKEPEWMAGVAGASVSSPGPYDKEGDTFYNVGSLAAYSPESAESYLREYNKYILQILNIHEAIPGHYAQLIYSNQSPSIIKSILGNGAMVEGWAVYTERMMLEEGWAKNTEINGKVEEDEMWLMYYKWHLRVVCNTILDYSVHTLNMPKEEAMSLLMNEAFQEKAEAEGKWRRVTLTQVQLCSYFTGYTEIYEFRERTKEKLGNKFDLKAFHEKFLSYGSAPVKYIKALME